MWNSMNTCTKFQADVMQNGWGWHSECPKRPHFTLFPGILAYCWFSNCSTWEVHTVLEGHFSLSTKNVPKTYITPPKHQILRLAFDLVTSDDLDLTRGHQRLRRVLKSIPDTIRAVSPALLQSDMAALPGEASFEIVKIKIWLLARPGTSTVIFR